MDKTKIEWTRGDDGKAGATWNPLRGCTPVSEGCANCYAAGMASRFCKPGLPYHGFIRGDIGGWNGKVRLLVDELDRPLRWRRPRRVFVNSTSDTFHEWLTALEIVEMYGTMERAPQHTFLVLTKRAKRMAEWYRSQRNQAAGRPLRNVWLGVTCENQRALDARVPKLLECPAALRFLSLEPLLEPVDLGALRCGGIGWVIVGGESGPSARPCQVEWIRDVIRQCRAAGVPVFVKQLGSNAGLGARPLFTDNSKHNDPDEWPAELRVREQPCVLTMSAEAEHYDAAASRRRTQGVKCERI